MQSRRRENYMAVSPAKLRTQRYEQVHDPCPISRSDMVGHCSPHRQGESQRDLDGHRGSNSVERREHGSHLAGRRAERVCLSSPHRHIPKRPHYDEEVMHRKHEFSGPLDFDTGSKLRMKRAYGFDHDCGAYGIHKEEDYVNNRILLADEHDTLLQKAVPFEEKSVRELYQLHSDLGPTSSYRESGVQRQLFSWSVDPDRFESKDIGYRDNQDFNGPVVETSKGGKPILNPTGAFYTSMSYCGDFASSSARTMQREQEHVACYWEDMPLPIDEYVPEIVEDHEYSERPHVDAPGNYETSRRNIASYKKVTCSPVGLEQEDYHYSKVHEILNSDSRYPPDDLYRIMPRNSQTVNNHSQMDFNNSEILKAGIVNPTFERSEQDNDYFGDRGKKKLLDNPLPEPHFLDYLDSRKFGNASRQHSGHLDSGYSHAEFGRRVPQDHELAHLRMTQDHQVAHSRSDHYFGRDVGPEPQNERMLKIFPVGSNKLEMHRHDAKSLKMDKFNMYEPFNRVPKRKYSIEEETNRYNPRSSLLTKYNETRDFGNPYSDEEWYNEGVSDLQSHQTAAYEHNDDYRVSEDSYDRQGRDEDFVSDVRFSSRESADHNLAQLFKHNHKYVKNHSRPGSSNWCNSHQSSRKSGFHKQKNFRKRKDHYHRDEANDGDMLEVRSDTPRCELCEESEDFKQLVHEAFLTYSKRLSETSSTRKRYTERGKAGTLFCIVCGRSYSKEFMDTQHLALHAFMSHKTGLRVQHLGLHKAICVLMGWGVNTPPGTITWAPQVLSSGEALAQKEDLILWPPLVIIHNISLLNNSGEQMVITPEMLESFLRGKGFVEGKIRVCLGKRAKESIMVVKFLGTFNGLGNAEKIHQYFQQTKRGRIDFDNIVSKSLKIGNESGAKLQNREEELVLYGYMGISEDLDKLDFNTKRTISIESKREIEELANAPVKAEVVQI